MKPCLFISLTLVLLLSRGAPGQTTPQESEMDHAVRDAASSPSLYGNDVAARGKLMHRIDLYEDALRKAKETHASDTEVGKIYLEIGLLSEEAQLWERAETNLESARSVLAHAPESSDYLAMTLSVLGNLHVQMQKFRQSEKEDEEALRLRENLQNPLLIARSRNDLAILYLAEHKYAKAKGFAQQAMAEFVVNPKTTIYDRISVRYALGLALCMSKDCVSAIVPLKDAVYEAKTSLQRNDASTGFGDFILGYAFWKSGNLTEADGYMKEGTAILNGQLGMGSQSGLAASRQYAKFLRETRRVDEAEVVERRIRQAEAVVDVHSIQAYQGGSELAGLR